MTAKRAYGVGENKRRVVGGAIVNDDHLERLVLAGSGCTSAARDRRTPVALLWTGTMTVMSGSTGASNIRLAARVLLRGWLDRAQCIDVVPQLRRGDRS